MSGWLKLCMTKGEDVFNLISHIEMLIEKSVTKIYTVKALTAYDKSVKDRADRVGIRAFERVDSADVLRHLCYDGTVLAQRLTYQKPKTQGKSKHSPNTCYAYNRPEGCRNDPCRYRHACDVCGIGGHPAEKCQKTESKK